MALDNRRIDDLIKEAQRWAARRIWQQGGRDTPVPVRKGTTAPTEQPENNGHIQAPLVLSAISCENLVERIRQALTRKGHPNADVRQSCDALSVALRSLPLDVDVDLSLNHTSDHSASAQARVVEEPSMSRLDILTAYILAVRACGGKCPYLKVAGKAATRTEAKLALARLPIELRVNIVSDPELPEFRRYLEIECRPRGESGWTLYTHFQLITDVATGDVWQYIHLIQGGAGALKRGSRLRLPIHWGSRWQDYDWAIRFLAGRTRPGRHPLKPLKKKED